MHKKENLIDITNYRIKLKRVDFSDIEVSDEEFQRIEKENIDILSKSEDKYEIADFSNKDIEIYFTRKKYFEPKFIFNLEVTFSLFYKIKKGDKDITLSNLKQELEERKKEILMPVTSKASLLIGNITNMDTESPPIITYPYLIDNE